MSTCTDNDRNHICDICLIELSKCGDEDRNHLCDVCSIPLSKCVDKDSDSICDFCFTILAWLRVTTVENCLVNNKAEDKVYNETDSYKVIFNYIGDDGRTVVGWIIYDQYGEYSRVNGNNFYSFTRGGNYLVVPIFAGK